MERKADVHIGVTNWRESRIKFGIFGADRRHHTYVIGKTGAGKTTLLKNLILQDIEKGKGVALIDPHGDLAKDLLAHIPPHRYNDVVYFDPSDSRPIGINVLDLAPSSILSAFRSIWADFWGPRMEYIFFHALVAAKDANQTLLGALRMLVDDPYREKVLRQCKTPATAQFWRLEYASYDRKFLTEAIAPIQNKVGRFLSDPIRDIVGQVKSTIDLRFMMDNDKIFIANLSKGTLGDDNSNLLGSLLVSMFQSAAMGRSTIPEAERHDFYLYVDEFQNFVSDAFATILSEARKYRLNLILAHQYLDQLTENVRDAVFGNVGTLITFRIGSPDAKFLSDELGVSHEDLQELPAHNIFLKLQVDGQQTRAFSAITLPPAFPRYEPERLIRHSRERYGRDARGKIDRWLSQ